MSEGGEALYSEILFLSLMISMQENTLVSQIPQKIRLKSHSPLQLERMSSPDVMRPSSRKDDGTEHDLYIMNKSLQCKAKDTQAEDGEILTVTIPNHR